MTKFYLVRFTSKQGKINKTLEGLGVGLLKLWALQNTTKTTECFIFDEYGVIVYHTFGDINGNTYIDHDYDGEDIEEYCPGIMLALKEGANV